MKLFLFVGAVLWLVCGLAGAWWLDDVRWKPVAKGPITLIEAFSEKPVSSPTP